MFHIKTIWGVCLFDKRLDSEKMIDAKDRDRHINIYRLFGTLYTSRFGV